MLRLGTILYPTDFSRCARQALPYAFHLARRHRAELHMLHAIVLHDDDPHNPAHHFPDIEGLHTLLRDTASAEMEASVERHGASDLSIRRVQERGISAAPVIVDYAARNDVDLVVIGTHGRRGLGHLLLGSVAEEVVRMAPCPVLTVRERKEPKSLEAIDHILVPIDFSDHSRMALGHAKELARTCDARLHLLHIVEQAVYPAFYRTFSVDLHDLASHIETTSKQAMGEWLEASVGPEVPADIHVLPGNAATEIIDFAESQEMDLIVIATHGLTGIEHLLLGSVTEKVVRQAPCPVFTVKPFGRSPIAA